MKKKLAASKFKSASRKAVPIKKVGKPIVESTTDKPKRPDAWLGCMRGEMEIVGDIVGPIGAFEELESVKS